MCGQNTVIAIDLSRGLSVEDDYQWVEVPRFAIFASTSIIDLIAEDIPGLQENIMCRSGHSEVFCVRPRAELPIGRIALREQSHWLVAIASSLKS